MKPTDSDKTNASIEFYSLDEALPDEIKINDTLYDLDQAQEFSGGAAKGQPTDSSKPYSVWSQEPTLMAMRNEITNLRGMLEQQLTGLAWNDLNKNNPQRAKLIKQLLELGFSPELADQVIQKAEGQNNVQKNNQNDSKPQDYRRAWQLTLSSLAEKLPIKDDDVALSGGVVALVGATGVGKTTTIAKLAARYALRHGRNNIVLITTDTYRIGALEQLRTYGRILGIPVKIAHNKKQLQDLLKMLAEKKFVLIDTAGMGQRDVRLMEQFSVISDCAMGLKTLLVLSSTTHRAALDETIRSFSNVEINGCILTKLDETTNLGGALSVVTEHQLPVAYISDGQRVPEDLHLARAHTLINRCVSIARRANQPLDNDSLELAYSRMPSHVSA
jgi:flagellar biosynthesis protein FlhF